jgi:6-phosphogluconolactonase
LVEDTRVPAMNRWKRTGAAAVATLALLFATGCPGFFVYPGSLNSSSSSTGDYVYVANGTAETLTGFSVGSGTLTEIAGLPISLGFVPTSVVVNPANTIVFVAGSDGVSDFIDAYGIESGGVLSLLTQNTLGPLADEVAIDVSPDGGTLVALDAIGVASGVVQVDNFQINTSTGQLTGGTSATYTFAGSSIPTIVPRAVKFAPNEDYVFVTLGTAGDLVFPFPFTPTTTAQPLAPYSGTSDNALAVNANGDYLYIARSGTSGGLAVFTISSAGALNQVGSTLVAGSQPISVLVNKAGTDIYVANQQTNTISGYAIASNEAVSALSPATDVTPSEPYALAVDNSGKYVLSASEVGNPDLTMFSYDSVTPGQLDLVTEMATGNDPTGPVAIAATH